MICCKKIVASLKGLLTIHDHLKFKKYCNFDGEICNNSNTDKNTYLEDLISNLD